MDRDGHRAALSQDTEAQRAAVAKAEVWRYHHAARLGVSVAEINAATLGGWCSEDIESLPACEAALLKGSPHFWVG